MLAHESYDAVWDGELQRIYKAGKARLQQSLSGQVFAAMSVGPPPASAFLPMPPGKSVVEAGVALLRGGKLGVLHLNGGLATRFGQIKATHEVGEFSGRKRTFLELKIAHVRWVSETHGGKILYGLMNSPMTDPITQKFLDDNNGFGMDKSQIITYVQSVLRRKIPSRVDLEEYFSHLPPTPALPLKGGGRTALQRNMELAQGKEGDFFQPTDSAQSDLQWAPAGHFDAVAALVLTRTIAQFMDAGVEFLQISNIDNLAATVEPAILGMLANGPEDLIVEVARKKPGDRGGIPVLLNGQGTVLLEEFALPKGFDAAQVVQFNTATYWIRISRILRIFGLTAAEVKTLSDEDLAGRVRQVRQRVPSHTVLKQVDVKGIGKLVLAQEEQLLGELTRLYLEDTGRSPVYLMIDTDKRFIPIKTKEDLLKQVPRIRAILQDRVLLN